MTEEIQPEIRRVDDATVEERSASQVAIDSVMAFGAAAGGTGTLLLGAAAAKQVFGGGSGEPSPTSQPGPEQPKKD